MQSLDKLRSLTFVLIGLVGAIGACSSDDSPSDPGEPTDTTRPVVVDVTPDPGEIGVALTDSVHVVFSEAMDPASASGQISMTPGSGVGYAWYTSRHLAIGHAAWSEGEEITVTVGAGLADEAGNTLAAAYTFSFYTVNTTELVVLETTPAGGTTGVNRDTSIILRFSAGVNTSTIPGNITITDNPLLATDFAFNANEIETGVVLLDPVDTLPASSPITVTVGTGVQSDGPSGLSLAEPYVFTFTTGVDLDTTPPTVVSVDPVNGNQSVPANQGYFSMTFSEPVNPDSLEPTRWNLAFLFLIEANDVSPIWSDGGRTFTIPLPSPLPAGMPISIVFDEFADLAGNVQTTDYVYEVKIAGTADYVPVADGQRFAMETSYEEGTIGDPDPTYSDGYDSYAEIDTQLDGSYRVNQYDSPDFLTVRRWEAYRKTASFLQWLGFEDNTSPNTPDKEDFDSPLDILPLPIAVGTWTDQTTVSISGEGSYRATLAGQVVEKLDYDIPGSDGYVFVKDAWRVVRVMDVEIFDDPDWVPAFVQRDTLIYGPTLGDVITSQYSEYEAENSWERQFTIRFPYIGMTKSLRHPTGWR
ncbi:MAG: Ig-like domain-containing protein [Candidatus Krumholzibacteriia bacterium]